jgi:hypothetical protein
MVKLAIQEYKEDLVNSKRNYNELNSIIQISLQAIDIQNSAKPEPKSVLNILYFSFILIIFLFFFL